MKNAVPLHSRLDTYWVLTILCYAVEYETILPNIYSTPKYEEQDLANSETQWLGLPFENIHPSK